MLRNFLRAVSRDWGSLVTGTASIPLTVIALWVTSPLQRTAWVTFAIACFIIASYRVWAFEHRRAEAAEERLATPARPWVVIDRYSSEYVEIEETGEEDLCERVHIVNRGQAPAVSIVIPEIPLAGTTARIRGSLPTLGPGEDTDVEIGNLHRTLNHVLRRLPVPEEGGPKSLRIRLVVEYRGLDHSRWTTEQCITCSFSGIDFSIAHPNDPQQWSDLTMLE